MHASSVIERDRCRKENTMFNDKNIIGKVAVMSDLHISYTEYSADEIAEKLRLYASAVADLRDISNGDLDAVMMCGDYSSIGCPEQARTFAQGTQVIFKGIFGNKAPKLLIGMGNHDTCWRPNGYCCITAKEWYEIFAQYGLTNDFADTSDTNLGNIRIDFEKQGRIYSLLYVETENYAENIFKPETLKWLDEMLLQITVQNPGRFVFVGTHGPVQESGIYGTDIKLEDSSDWATAKGNIDRILKKYPQVILFSGHTHLSDELETAIMQVNYTAINVPGALARDYYMGSERYLDDRYPDHQHGMGIYIEIDDKDNIRIRRINFSTEKAEITVSYTGRIPNPAAGTWPGEPKELSFVELASCRDISDGISSVYDPDWTIDAPDPDRRFLKKYSSERGRGIAPRFPQGAALQVGRSDSGQIRITFPAAQSEAYILFYAIHICCNGAKKELRALGNWCDIRHGAADGKNHRDAGHFEYELPSDMDASCEITVTAVDEYGNISPVSLNGSLAGSHR